MVGPAGSDSKNSSEDLGPRARLWLVVPQESRRGQQSAKKHAAVLFVVDQVMAAMRT